MANVGRRQAYRCGRCGRWFLQGNTACCVVHSDDSCCHYGDTEVPNPMPDDYEGVV